MKNLRIPKFSYLLATLLVAGLLFITGCKKDAFNEKDALAAQKDFLQMKYDQEIKLETLKQSGATALAQLQFNFALQQNAAQLRLQDSLARLYQRYSDSLGRSNSRYNDSTASLNSRKRDIAVLVTDQITGQPVAGATVTIPTLNNSVLQVATDANGAATFAAAGNANVPNPASAIVTKTGYASGSAYYTIFGSGTVAGTTTVSLWNQANARNTIRGKVTIQTNFVNGSVDGAAGKLVNLFATVAINGSSQMQRFDWSTLTDASGNYSINVPDLPGGSTSFAFSYNTFDTTARLAVNSFAPGTDTIPSIQSVPVTYYLGTATTATALPAQAQGVGVSVPAFVNRYHGVSPVDVNGRTFYFKAFNFNTATVNNNFAAFVATNGAPLIASQYDAGGLATSSASAFTANFSGTTTLDPDNVSVRFVDVLNNSDGLWQRAPSLVAGITPGPATVKTFVIAPYQLTATNPTLNSFLVYTKRIAAAPTSANNYAYDPLAWGIINPSLSLSTTVNAVVQNKGLVGSSINAGSYSASTNTGFATTDVSGGQTIVMNLSYGVGQLKQGVR